MVGLTHPLALLLLLPALVLALSPRAARAFVPAGLPGDWAKVIVPELRPLAAGGTPEVARDGALAVPLAIWCLLVLALAGPGIESGTRQGFGNLAGRVIVLDLGAGADVTAQRVAANRLLDLAPEVPTAIVAATADAFDVMPLTRDRRQIDRYLQVVDPGLMPLGGRATGLAIGHAEGLLQRAGIVVGQVVLVTGGTPPASPPGAASGWLRAVVVVRTGSDRQREAWRGYAVTAAARLADDETLAPVAQDLARTAALAARQAGEWVRLDLTPLPIAAAAVLWLLLFRRRLER